MTTFMVMTSAVYVAALFSVYMVVKTLNGMRG